MIRPALLLLLCLLANPPAAAVQLVSGEIQRIGERYGANLVLLLQPPPEQVWRALLAFEHLPELDPAFHSVEVSRLADGDGFAVRSVAEACALMFCQQITHEQEIRVRGEHELEARTLPAGSDFRYGLWLWQLNAVETPAGGGTELRVAFELEPDFWVPPVLGSWLLRRHLLEHALRSSAGLEQLARHLHDPDALQ